MNSDPTSHGLWETTAPPAPDTHSLSGVASADVVVVGAGYTGLSAALHLAEAGADVVVLEGADVGFGGSGRNVGLVNAGLWVTPDDLPKILGEIHGERLLALLGDAPRVVFELIKRYDIACEATRAGTLHCAVGLEGLAELERRVAQWAARGAPVRLLDTAETAAKVGSTAYAGALLDLRAGTIQPLAYARGLAAAALKSGARIHTQSAVLSTERAGGRWLVRTASGSVSADWVVVATNAYGSAPWPEIRAELTLLPYFNLATQPLGDNVRRSILPERQGAWDTRKILSSFRFDQSGRMVFGSVGALRGTGAAVHRAWGLRALKKLFPQIGDVRFEAGWFGMIGMTQDNLPRFHRFADNVVGFSGYNGRGIAPGTVFGQALAGYVTATTAEADLPLPLTDPTRPRFRAAKEAGVEIGAQLAHVVDARF